MNPGAFKLDTQDCLTWLPSQKAGRFQLFVLDPPYNVDFRYDQYKDRKFQKQYYHEQLLVLSHCAQLLGEGGSIFYVNYPEMAARIWAGVDFLTPVKWLTWVYHTHLTGKPLRRASRGILWFSKGEPRINPEAFLGEYQNPEDPRIQERMGRGLRPVGYDWIEMEPVKNTSREKRSHPCQLPEKLVEKFILGTTKEGDLVGDCYAGSGTTAICAIRNNRSFAGCELDPSYVQVAKAAVQALNEHNVTENAFPLRSGGRSDQIGGMVKNDFEKHCQGFLKDMAVMNYSPLSVQKYSLCVKRFLGFLGKREIGDLRKVDGEVMKAYHKALLENPKYSHSYKGSNIRAVKLFFKYLKKNKTILFDFSSLLKEPRAPRELPKAPLTSQEVKAMLEAPDLRDELGIRDRAILETFYSTGIRIQEMSNLSLLDLDLEGGYLFVREGKGGKDRVVPLGKHACFFIRTYLEGARPSLVSKNAESTNRLWVNRYGRPLVKGDIVILVRKYREKAGIEKQVTAHSFRRTLAVELIRNDCDFLSVKKILGHSLSKTTLRYCAVAGVELKDVLKRCHPRHAEVIEDAAPQIKSVV